MELVYSEKAWSDKATPSSLTHSRESKRRAKVYRERERASEGLALVRGECCFKEACSEETGSNKNGSDYHEEVSNKHTDGREVRCWELARCAYVGRICMFSKNTTTLND